MPRFLHAFRNASIKINPGRAMHMARPGFFTADYTAVAEPPALSLFNVTARARSAHLSRHSARAFGATLTVQPIPRWGLPPASGRSLHGWNPFGLAAIPSSAFFIVPARERSTYLFRHSARGLGATLTVKPTCVLRQVGNDTGFYPDPFYLPPAERGGFFTQSDAHSHASASPAISLPPGSSPSICPQPDADGIHSVPRRFHLTIFRLTFSVSGVSTGLGEPRLKFVAPSIY